MSGRPRPLSAEERRVLEEVRTIWGPQNHEADVFFPNDEEAAIFVKDRDGGLPLCVSLTNLGRWHADGSLSLAELREHILGPAARPRRSLSARLLPAWLRHWL
jgi:hypothetical protein